MSMYYRIDYTTSAWAQVEALDGKRRTAFLEGMSHLVTDPFPEGCIRFDNEAQWRVTNYLTVSYLVGTRILSVVSVVELHDTKPLFREVD